MRQAPLSRSDEAAAITGLFLEGQDAGARKRIEMLPAKNTS
jgi:hypothetical protein